MVGTVTYRVVVPSSTATGVMTWLKRPRTPGVCCRELTAVGRRYGSTFTLRSPIFGDAVIVSGRSLVRDLFTTNGDLVARASNLGSGASGRPDTGRSSRRS
jgi:hypothetical protein